MEKRGKWLKNDFDMDTLTKITREATDMDTVNVYCSECNSSAGLNKHGEVILSNYCPTCGIKMEVKQWTSKLFAEIM